VEPRAVGTRFATAGAAVFHDQLHATRRLVTRSSDGHHAEPDRSGVEHQNAEWRKDSRGDHRCERWVSQHDVERRAEADAEHSPGTRASVWVGWRRVVEDPVRYPVPHEMPMLVNAELSFPLLGYLAWVNASFFQLCSLKSWIFGWF
jgi:hypothetical protein